MTFEEILNQAIAMLQRRGRVTYRTLRLQFQLDEEQLEALKEALIEAERLAVDEEGRVLVWAGAPALPPQVSASQGVTPDNSPAQAALGQDVPATAAGQIPHSSDAERRQLTVLFCDLADSTRLARQLDPEDLRAVVRAYQETAAAVIQRYEGHIAQYLGDGLLVYFGYPQAHEDDTQRAVRTGLELLAAMRTLNPQLVPEQGVQLAVRIGIHTGLVVVGAMGSGERHEHLALGDTPNLAARLQGLAAPDTVVLSDTTARLVQGYFVCHDRGRQTLKGLDTPVRIFQVVGESAAQSRLEVAAASGLTPLVGRETEVTLLRERWAQARDGLGQVVLLSGEAGIGKSRLVRVLTERVVTEGALRLTVHCSPYHTHSAFYPVIDHLQRRLHWHRDVSPEARLARLEQAVQAARLPLEEVVLLLAALLAVPLPEGRYAPLTLPSHQQRQQTLDALVAWLLEEAERQPVLAVYEDLHWADPSTLELLGMLVAQAPTASMLHVLTFRPDFVPPWPLRSHMTPLTLSRLERPQVEALLRHLAGGKALPAEVVQYIVTKTDGVPLFVEELTKMLLESTLLREDIDHYTLLRPLASLTIPATLRDALMARLERVPGVKEVAQLGAVLGREFPYAWLRGISPLDEDALQNRLAQLVASELLYQRGRPPRARYIFKHALVQDAAYQSLLRGTRRQYHQQSAQVLEERFPETVETQPELLAHHYTAAGRHDRAVDYWHKAGQKALARSAHVEAITHLNTGLAQLATLPETAARVQQELDMQITLGRGLVAVKGYGAPEVGHAYSRAWALCQQVGETHQTSQSLWGLSTFHFVRGELQTAYDLGTQCLTSAQRLDDTAGRISAHATSGATLFRLGDFLAAREHLEQGIALYHPRQHPTLIARFAQDTGINCYNFVAHTLWLRGYADQALARSREMIAISQRLSHPYSLGVTLFSAARLHVFRREVEATLDLVEAFMQLAAEQAFAFLTGLGTILRGWALVARGDVDAGLSDLREGITSVRSTGARVGYHLAYLAEAYAKAGRTDEGLRCVDEALALMDTTAERDYEAEIHRLKGILLLSQPLDHQTAAEACFQHALTIARRQQAKSWELRTAMSLSRLWQQQGKRAEARELLAPVYGWFTEGFATAELEEAQAVLAELEEGRA